MAPKVTQKVTKARWPSLIGVIHLPPLAGAPDAVRQHPSHTLAHAGALAVQEAVLLVKAGFEGIILENYGDAPFYSSQVPPETVAQLAVLAAAVREVTRIPIGVNVLRNDSLSAHAIAAVTGCEFIRVNVLNGVAATDQGLIEGRASTLLRERARLRSEVAILADVHVKHAVMLSSHDIGHAASDLIGRGGADGLIVTGESTGEPVAWESLETVSKIAQKKRVPIYVGSGVTLDAVGDIRRLRVGVIVSSALRKGGTAGEPLDVKRVRAFASAWKKAGRS